MTSALRNRTRSNPQPRDRTDTQFDRYRIITARSKDGFSAVAYIGTEKILAVDGASQDAVDSRVRGLLEERMNSLRENRVSGLPGATELFEAMIAAGQRELERLRPVLKCHSSFDDGIADLKDIAHRLRIDEASVVGAYLGLSRKLCAALKCQPEDISVPVGLTPALVVLRPCEDVAGQFVGYALRDAFLESVSMVDSRRPQLKLDGTRR